MSAAETLSITLEDKYTRVSGRVFLTGSQALVRLPLLQRQRDLAAVDRETATLLGQLGMYMIGEIDDGADAVEAKELSLRAEDVEAFGQRAGLGAHDLSVAGG
ncbi:MAG: hypothetical protein OSW77_14250, partial [Proteobacteria bacterium]|nr:hypothetical protein [Pseudomonadota bacterium]